MVVDRLAALVSEHLDDLPPYAWASESDRWCELLTCLLHVRLPSRTYAEVRDMVHQLREVDTLLAESLAELDQAGPLALRMREVMAGAGLTDAETQAAVTVLCQTASSTCASYGGRVQRCLRRHALAARDELVDTLAGLAITADDRRLAVSLWLQNTTNAPIALADPSTRDLCESLGVSAMELEEAADALDLNLGVVDDLAMLLASRSAEGA